MLCWLKNSNNLNFRPEFWSKDDFCSRFTSVYTWITYSKIYKGMPDQVDIFLTFLSPRKKPKSRKFSKKVRSLNFKAKIFVTYQIMFSRIFVKNVQFRSNYRFKVPCMQNWPWHVTYPKYKNFLRRKGLHVGHFKNF